MAASVSVLLALIAAATDHAAYPARIDLTAAALERIALQHMTAGSALHTVCAELHNTNSTGAVDGSSKSFDSDAARVIGFFLERSTRTSLQCVSRCRPSLASEGERRPAGLVAAVGVARSHARVLCSAVMFRAAL